MKIWIHCLSSNEKEKAEKYRETLIKRGYSKKEIKITTKKVPRGRDGMTALPWVKKYSVLVYGEI